MMNNEDKFYRDLIKKFFDNFIISSKKHPQDRKPQSKEEKILLPFLLQWMKERKDRKIIKDEFNQVYKKDGYLYIPKRMYRRWMLIYYVQVLHILYVKCL